MYPKLTSELSHKSICFQGAIEASKILGMKTMGAGEGVRYSRLQEVGGDCRGQSWLYQQLARYDYCKCLLHKP